MKININTILIIILGVILFLQRECSGDKQTSGAGSKDSVFYGYDSTTHTIQVPVPVIVPGASVPYPVPANADTAAILQKYFTANNYVQTIEDSNLVAIIDDTIKENMIARRSFTYRWKKPVQTITIKFPEPKARIKVFAGIHTHVGLKGFALGPELLLVTKKDHAYKVNYDFINNGIGIGTHWKLSLRK